MRILIYIFNIVCLFDFLQQAEKENAKPGRVRNFGSVYILYFAQFSS